MDTESLVAYCGLFCGECAISKGIIGKKSRELLDQLENPDLQNRLKEMPDGMAIDFDKISDSNDIANVLDALSTFNCEHVCKDEKDATECIIKDCCKKKGLEGCWQCDLFEGCDTLGWLRPVNGEVPFDNIRQIRAVGMEAFLAD